ncbi:MAG: type III-A CRISPR-associated protein Cas10/Csm1 [Candidatus Hydrogenedentes bacterium]|nr:type III-A CRISPR-associated protein Cas10/Csm1 [Candidatus Hydrogenedentota bacterium]
MSTAPTNEKKKLDVMKVALAGLLYNIGDQEIVDRIKNLFDGEPKNLEEKILKLSDWLASGERRTNENTVPDIPSEARLENIFDNLEYPPKDGNTQSITKTHFSVSEITDYSNFFPIESNESSSKEGKKDYDLLWKRFRDDLTSLGYSHNTSLNLSYTTWLSLMRKYTSRIPSATPTSKGKYAPDISLYQHSKITSAISACLAHNFNNGVLSESDIDLILNIFLQPSDRDSKSPKENTPNESDLPVIATFLGGDVSGIQEYIYNIPTKGAAKQLKARSFLIQLLCDFVATYICEYFDLPYANIIYSSGGRFYILLPVIKDTKYFEEKLKEISEKLLKFLKGELHLITATIEVKPHHFLLGGFNEIWRNVTSMITAKKRNKYLLFATTSSPDPTTDNYELIFGLKDSKEYPIIKQTAGAEDEKTPDRADQTDMEEIGKKLRNAKYIIRRKTDKIHRSENPAPLEFVNALGYNYEFYHDLDQVECLDNVEEIIFINQFDLKVTPQKFRANIPEIQLSFKTYANYWPTINELPNKLQQEIMNDSQDTITPYQPVYFEHLAEGAIGTNKIGIFRVDVDSMGDAFKEGLKKHNTLSRSAMLSNLLSEFFEGYVNYLAQQDPYKGLVGVIYSGGDDLFVVGAWNKVFDFALKLQEDFKKYTNGRLSISGGIVVVDAKVPLRLTAKMAEEAESSAKSYKRKFPNNGKLKEKDTIVLFDTPIGYEELHELLEIRDNLLEIYQLSKEDSSIPFGGIFHKLQSIFANYLAQKQLKEIRKSTYRTTSPQLIKEITLERWRWLMVYSLRRYLKEDVSEKGSSNKQKLNGLLTNITDKLLQRELSSRRTYKIEDKIGAILRWVELITREKN